MWNLFRRKNDSSIRLFFNTDMHCHILPGVDDGSRDMEMSLELIDRMRAMGLTRLIATPHVFVDRFPNTPEILDNALHELNSALAERMDEEQPFVVERSAEYHLDELFVEQLEAGLLTPLPGNHLLIENSFLQEAWGMDGMIFDLKIKGYNPILAHPERYRYYHSNRDRYEELHARGVKFQVNILSLAGYYGKPEMIIANWLMNNDMIDYLGTDLHNHSYSDAISRFLTTSAYRKVESKLAGRIGNDKDFIIPNT